MICQFKGCMENAAGMYNEKMYCRDHYFIMAMKDDIPGTSRAKDVGGKPKVGYVLKSLTVAVAKVREYGNKKYPNGGIDNWRHVDEDEYYHALKRHVDSMCDAKFNTKSRENCLDPESGMPHAWHAATNLMFIIERLAERNNSFPDKEIGPSA